MCAVIKGNGDTDFALERNFEADIGPYSRELGVGPKQALDRRLAEVHLGKYPWPAGRRWLAARPEIPLDWTMTELNTFSLDRVVLAVERVRDRLLRATAALEAASVDYAVVGGNAVAAWIARVDVTATRTTRDVDLLLRRTDLDDASSDLARAGFVHRRVSGLDDFLDGPEGTVRDAVHIVFAGERVRPDEAVPNPDVTESEAADDYRILSLEALVRIKLTAFRDKDRTHLRDLLDVGLIDASWCHRFQEELGVRLQQLVDTPEG